MQKTILTTVVIIIIIFGAFLYFTRPVSAPTQSLDSVAEKIVPTSETDGTASEEKLYRIASAQSQVQFSIGEILRGSQFTAVGKTSEVGGDILISNTAIKVGTMTVNAKTFKTDSTQRDGAIVRFILKSDKPENEFVTFKPAQPIALTTPLVDGKEITATISGDLTISGITKLATFAIKIKTQGGKLLATGETTVKRSDFGLKIPELSFLASVDDQVKVTISTIADLVL